MRCSAENCLLPWPVRAQKTDLNMTSDNINSSLQKYAGHKTIRAHKHLGIMLQLNQMAIKPSLIFDG